MLDELSELFERDGRKRPAEGSAAQKPGGVRGFFARIFGGGESDDQDDPRYDERQGRAYRDDQRQRRRERDELDFGDD